MYKYLAFLLCSLGILLRFTLSKYSIGTNDAINLFYTSSLQIEHGLVWMYQNSPFMNNPPLANYIVASLLTFSKLLQVSFFFILRLPGIVGEIISLFSLWRISKGSFQVVLLFAFSLQNVLVSGYHGSLDGVCLSLLLLACSLLESKKNIRLILCGFCFGLALQVKLLPLILLPAFLIKGVKKHTLVFLALFVPPLLLTQLPTIYFLDKPGFFEAVFGYKSIPDYWGIHLFLELVKGNISNYFYNQLYTFTRVVGPYFLLTGSSILAIKFAHLPIEKLSALILTFFACFASGFGFTYLSYLCPFLLLLERKRGTLFLVLAGISQLLIYCHFLISFNPLQSVHLSSSPKHIVLLMFIVWAFLLEFLVTVLVREYKNTENVQPIKEKMVRV
jgi:hypothetical protein